MEGHNCVFLHIRGAFKPLLYARDTLSREEYLNHLNKINHEAFERALFYV